MKGAGVEPPSTSKRDNYYTTNEPATGSRKL